MSDSRLRELERRWKETGSVEDEAAWLAEQMRGYATTIPTEVFIDCSQDERDQCELFIAGNARIGWQAVLGRDPFTQAVFSLSDTRPVTGEELALLLTLLTGSRSHELASEGYDYERVVLLLEATDLLARQQLTGLMKRQAPELVRQGRLVAPEIAAPELSALGWEDLLGAAMDPLSRVLRTVELVSD